MTRRLLGLVAALALGSAHAEPAVWAVTGADSTVYLFGSVHVLPEGGFAIAGALERAYLDVDRVCLEIDIGALDEAQMTAQTLARALDPEGRSLFDLLGPAAGSARERAASAGFDLAPLAPFEPWFAGLTISMLALKQHGYEVEHGVERIIHAAAVRDSKAGCGLETFDQQLGMLDSLSAELQQEMLLQSLEDAGKVDEVIVPMLAAWRGGDEAALARRLEEDFAEYPELSAQIVFARNERWAAQVAAMLEGTENVLVVVGALHLVGARGLPALLEQRGFTVERR